MLYFIQLLLNKCKFFPAFFLEFGIKLKKLPSLENLGQNYKQLKMKESNNRPC